MAKRARNKPVANPALSPQRKQVGIVALILCIATIAVFANGINGTFVFDDMDAIVYSPATRHLWPPWHWMAAKQSSTAAGRPVLQLSLALNFAINGLREPGYHVVNIAIHALAGLVLFGVVRRTLLLPKFDKRFEKNAHIIAGIIAGLWMIHPIQTNSVTYIVQRAEAMTGLCILLTLYCSIRAATIDVAKNRRGWIAGAIIASGIGMATKEVAAVAPLLVMLYDWCFLDDFKSRFRQRVWLYLGLMASWLVLIILMAGGYRASTTGFALSRTWWEYFRTQPSIILRYLSNVFYPRLVLDYWWQTESRWLYIIGPGVFLIVLFMASVIGVWKKKWWGFVGAWFFLILAPTSSFVPISDMAMDHRMYLSLAAPIALLVMFGVGMIQKKPALRTMGIALVAISAIWLGFWTMRRNWDFQNLISIWDKTIVSAPQNPRARYNLATAYEMLGNEVAAEKAFQAALDVSRDYTWTHFRYGSLLFSQGRLDEAIAIYRDGLAHDENFAPMYARLGMALVRKGEVEEGERNIEKAIRLEPASPQSQMAAGHMRMMQGRISEAIKHYELSVRIDPLIPDTQNFLGLAYSKIQQFDKAYEHLSQAVELRPGYAEAHLNLGAVLIAMGRNDEAITHFESAVKIRPDYVDAHFNLGVVYLQQRKLSEARQHLAKVVEINPTNAQAKQLLGQLDAQPGG